jgi:DNA-binding IclR family transcriptional regulator
MTAQELARATGFSTNKVHRLLNVLRQEGCLQRMWVQRESLDGRLRLVPAYSMVPPSARGGDECQEN